jgi:hypothetical protein
MNASNYAQWFTKAALAAMLAFALAATALAGGNPPDDMNGVWTGETASGQTSAITLTLGEASSSLRYGNPRSCILGLEDAIDNPDGSRKYALATSTAAAAMIFSLQACAASRRIKRTGLRDQGHRRQER